MVTFQSYYWIHIFYRFPKGGFSRFVTQHQRLIGKQPLGLQAIHIIPAIVITLPGIRSPQHFQRPNPTFWLPWGWSHSRTAGLLSRTSPGSQLALVLYATWSEWHNVWVNVYHSLSYWADSGGVAYCPHKLDPLGSREDHPLTCPRASHHLLRSLESWEPHTTRLLMRYHSHYMLQVRRYPIPLRDFTRTSEVMWNESSFFTANRIPR